LSFFEINSVFDLNNLLNKARGVKIKKNIIVSKILGIIWLNIIDILNHIFSISLESKRENTPIPERNKHK